MKTLALTLSLLCISAFGREAKLTRYPSYYQGRVAFSYMGDIWTADDNGQNVQRLTVHSARDIYPRFSPDGKWIAFSSDRNGNLDVFIIPAKGGDAKQLTFHSADDNVLGWTPDSRNVLFSSQRGEDFMAKLYTISVDGGLEHSAGPDMGIAGSYSPDGKKLAINRKGQVYWRKYYRGAYNTDVTVMDLASKKFTDLTTFEGIDSWPMWAHDGFIYFVSDREDGKSNTGLTNIWRVPEGGGPDSDKKAQQITTFKSGDVRFPSISADGKTIVFEHDFGVSKLDVATRKVTPIKIDISTEVQENMTDMRTFTSRVDQYNVAPNGRRIALSIHGEIFTTPVDGGDLTQITDDPARDQDPVYSPDGKQIAFISDRSGREEIHLVAADGVGGAQRVTDQDSIKSNLSWSPDSKLLAFNTLDDKLFVYDVASKQTRLAASSTKGNIGAAVWSPDGKWIAYSKADASRTTNIYLTPVVSNGTGGQERVVTFDSDGSRQPKFSADSKKLYFTRSAGGGRGGRGGGGGGAQIYVIALEKQDHDPEDTDTADADAEAAPAAPAGRGGGRGGNTAANAPVKEAVIDWDGLKRRTREVTRMPSGVQAYVPAMDSRTLIFVTSEGAGLRTVPVIYSTTDDGRRQTRLSAGGGDAAAGGGRGGRGGGGGGGGGGIRNLNLTRDGRTLFYEEGGSVYSINVGVGGATGGGRNADPTAAPPGGAGARRQITFTAKVRVAKQAEWAEMFSDAWRTMKYRFYDSNMHGYNWDGARAKYQPLVEYVADKYELMNIINEMIGELNASHTGAAVGPGARENAVTTSHLGLDLVPDEAAGRFKVAYVYEDGPCDKDWVKVKAGDYLIAIDNTPVLATTNYWKLLSNERLNRRVLVTFNSKPSEDGAWKSRVDPITAAAYSQLRYERWVKDRRADVDKLSGGKVGYLHIQAMDPPSLAKFEKEIHENRDKKALVIDQLGTAAATLSRNCSRSWSRRNTRSGVRAAPMKMAVRSRDTSGRRSCCRTGVRLRMRKCSRRGLRRWGSARRSVRRRWAL